MTSIELNDSSDPNLILNDQENATYIDYLYLLLKILLILGIFLVVFKRKKRDLKKMQIKECYIVPKDKIIIAIEIDGFFAKISHKLESGFQPLQIQTKQVGLIWKSLQKIIGYQLSFKPFYSTRQIINFVKSLKNSQRVELILYTSLTPQITDALLKKLKLSEYFSPENRKFCDPKQHDTMKHAIDVDKQSRRVVIITPCKRDHNWEDQKYFLVQNPKGGRNKNLLKDCLRHIKTLVDQNQSLDTLHDQLAQLKIDVQESDMSDISDIERQMS